MQDKSAVKFSLTILSVPLVYHFSCNSTAVIETLENGDKIWVIWVYFAIEFSWFIMLSQILKY